MSLQQTLGRVFQNLDKSLVPQLYLMKQIWNTTTSNKAIIPQVNIYNVTSKYQSVDIIGIMNNSIQTTGDTMVGNAAWMTYPISLYDTTKMNFTLQWSNVKCPQSLSIINCSPQGGFALVFQQESVTALGEFVNNLGEGLGYDGLSGLIAFEFDTYSSVHNGQHINENLMINVQIRNPNTKLLSTKQSSSLLLNDDPLNFANFNYSDFSKNYNIEVGIIPNQVTQELLIILIINGTRMTISTTFKEIGLDITRTYYTGFTSSQNLNQNVASGSLSVKDFRIFKTKPKFVDGQVSYLYDYYNSKNFGNYSKLEVRSSFYDLCMQKTTFIVYPTVSISSWAQGNESDPYILPFMYDSDTFVTLSDLPPLTKYEFYKPSILYLTADVKFTVNIPSGRSTAIRMGFYSGTSLIMNITAIDYIRQSKQLDFAYIVLDNSDLITATLSTKGYVNNNYQFNVYCYDKEFNTIQVTLDQLQLSVTSEYIRLNDTVYSNAVPLTCYTVVSSSQQNVDPTKSYQFTCTFLPNVNGTYYINSPYLPSGKSFKVEIAVTDTIQVQKYLSSDYSIASVLGDFVMYSGSTVEIYIDLRDYTNNSYSLSSDDGCTFTKSYYYQNGLKYSFLFYDGYPYLRTQITKAGVADFKISVSCTRVEFDIQCYRCQKIIIPQLSFYYYQMTIPAYPSTYDTLLADTIYVQQGNNFAVDFTFYDRFDNQVETELDTSYLSNIKFYLQYGRTVSKYFNFTTLQIPGKVMLYLNNSDNQYFKTMLPRTNLYQLNMTVPPSAAGTTCSSSTSIVRKIYIVPNDKIAPIEFISDQDTNRIDANTASIYWDRTITAGKIARLHFTVRNTNMLQMPYWVSPINTTDWIDGRIQDETGKSIKGTNCYIKFGYGLYEGEYLGWFYCQWAPKFTQISLQFNGTNLTCPLPTYTVPNDPTTVNIVFSQTTFTNNMTIGSNGVNITFKISDSWANGIDTLLMRRDQPQMGVITYNLTKIDSGICMKFGPLAMVNNSGFYRIHINEVPVGVYRLQLNLAQPITVDVTFNSSSNKVSPIYSYAVRDGGLSTVNINSYITIKFYARNIHNQSINSFPEQQLLIDQCDVYLSNSIGQNIMMNISGTFTDTLGKYYNYTTIEPVKKNAVYQANIYMTETGQTMQVVNGTFNVFDNLEPSVSELYLVKGIDQKEFRMIQYDTAGSLNNSFNASHYDPRHDGSLRFKLYFRTNFNFETLSVGDFSTIQFTGAYLGYALYNVSTSSYYMATNLTNITLQVILINNEYLLVTPKTWADQDRIDALVEGYYFIFIRGTNFVKNTFTLQWMFSLFNSDNNPVLTSSTQSLFVPRFINITAGEPYTFTAVVFGGTKGPSFNTLTRQSSDCKGVEIDTTTQLSSFFSNTGYLFYVTVYHEVATTCTISLQFSTTSPNKNITVQVNPAPLFQMQLLSTTQLNVKKTTIGTSIAFNFTFVDRWGNNVMLNQRTLPSLRKIQDMVQVYHQNNKPIQKNIFMVNSTTYQANFTTYYAGTVSFIAPIVNYTFTQMWNAYYNISFEISSALIPSAQTSYAILRNRDATAGQLIAVEVNLLDQYSNRLTSIVYNSSQYLINAIPDNGCNASSYNLAYANKKSEIVNFTGIINKACSYQINVIYFSPTEGQVQIPCLNCYLRVSPAAEDYRRIEFLDTRDIGVSQNNKLTLYIGKSEWNPKLIMTFRDSLDNLVTSTKTQLSANYTFDIVQTGSETVLIRATWNSINSFNYLFFCNETSITMPCFNASTYSTARLRIQQIKWNTTTVLNKVFIPITFVDNYGLIYNSDSLNDIANNYTYMRILNQDVISSLGYDLPVLPDQCMGNDQYPIIGRIDIKTIQGFRINNTFENLSSRMQLQLVGVNSSQYSYQFISGNTQGILLFVLFMKDDYYNDVQSATAKLYIDNVEFTNRQIQVDCRRRIDYTKYMIASNGTMISRLDFSSITAGTDVYLRITAADPNQANVTIVLPYEDKVFINYIQESRTIAYSQLLQDSTNKQQRYTFSEITETGVVQVIGVGISDTTILNFTVTADIVAADYSLVQADAFRITAGSNGTVWITPFDQYGNSINYTNNSQAVLRQFTNFTTVQYAKLNIFGQEYWQTASCFDIVNGRVKCSIQLTEKGIYKWRALISGKPAQCIYCYTRVVPTGKVKLSSTILTDLSQNYYANQHFGIGKFNIFPKSNFLYLKVYLRDDYDNAYVNEDSQQVETIWPVLRVTTVKDLNLTYTRTMNSVQNTAHVYKVMVTSDTNSQNTYYGIVEGIFTLRLSANSLGSYNFYLFIKSNRTSTGYPSLQTSLTMKFRQSTFWQTAGKLASVQFGVFDQTFNFIQNFNVNQTFTYVQPLDQVTQYSGDQIIGQYRGFYEKFLQINKVNSTDVISKVYQQQYTMQVNGFNQGGENKFSVIVFPDTLSKITYFSNNTQFQCFDSQGNDIDFFYDNLFLLKVISNKTPPILYNNFTLDMNYSSRFGTINTAFTQYMDYSTLTIIDGTQKSYSNAFVNYTGKGIVDLTKSNYVVNTQSIVAGKTFTVKINLLDINYQPVDITANTQIRQNLMISLLYQNQQTLRTYNFSTATIFKNTIQMSIQVNQSGYHFLQVSYSGIYLPSIYGYGYLQWLFVDIDPTTGTTLDSQWTIQMTAIQRNKVSLPQISNGTEYVSFQKSQPIFFLAKLCDRYGNLFEDAEIYSFYNVGDTALQSRIRNYGSTRQLNLNTQIIWNLMTISATDSASRALIKEFVPSYYPIQNNVNYDSYKSYKIDIYAPSNSTSNINLKVVYLVVTSDYALDVYHSMNTTNNQILETNGIYSTDFDNGAIKLRQNKKHIYTIQVRNTDLRPYLAENILNFTLAVTNTTTVTLRNTTNPKNITNYTANVTVDTISIQIIPFCNDAFYRIYFYSSTLYQDSPLQVRSTLRTNLTYNSANKTNNISLWVFPPVPPNYLNSIINTTFLSTNQTQFAPATKVTFYLTLQYNNQTFVNDYQSANQIKIYRKSTIEQVTASLINRNLYTVSVNLEGPQTNQFRIYYQDFNGALYPLTTPNVIYFSINTSIQLKSPLMYYYNPTDILIHNPTISKHFNNLNDDDNFKYYKLTREYDNMLPNLQSYDINKIKLTLINNLFNSTYIIGNEFRASILVIDSSTSRCLLSTDYSPYTDLVAKIYSYDSVSKQIGRISIDVDSITLVKKEVVQSTSYCTYYSVAVFESTLQLNTEGNYSMVAIFKNQISANFTFQAKVSGIDFSKTTIGWYSTTSTTADTLIAGFNAYDEFNYIIYFVDVQGNTVSDRKQSVKIQIKFDQSKLTEGNDYKYISRYDDRFKGYLVTIQFYKSGSYQPEYYFNLQRAGNIQVVNGPLLFVVSDPQCIKISILSSSSSSLALGQLFTFSFYCFDINGKEITENLDNLLSKTVFTNSDQNNQQIYGSVESLQNGIYRVTQKFYIEGTYTLKIYFNSLLIYSDTSKNYTVKSNICKDYLGNLMYQCPNNPSFCANNYYECNYINQTKCVNPSYPFLCGDKCVSNMASECCKINDRQVDKYVWCPHQNTCVNLTQSTCHTTNSSTPFYCQSTNSFVRYRHECCADYQYNVTVMNGTNTTLIAKSMTKCTYEDKCVPENTYEYCFYSFPRNCAEAYDSEFAYQCRNDGKCRRNLTECPSPRVCPYGYTQCPDYTCIQGLNKFSSCNKLQNCTKTLPDGSLINYIRCPDGSCSKQYEDCPSLISCMVSGQVVCPDGSCKNSELECIQPSECTSDQPYKCPGFPSVCAISKAYCPQPAAKTCGSTQSLCANGDCSTNCSPSSSYKVLDQTGLVLYNQSCASRGLIQCPNMECRSNYVHCSDVLYCPIPINYTYSPQSIICPGSNVCALQRSDCSYSSCESSLNSIYVEYSDSQISTLESFSRSTCYDGRCYIQGWQKQLICMTPISCSLSYFKSGGFGEFCLSSTNRSQSLMELSILLNDYKCSKNQHKCVTGECRSSPDDCPSQVTCPENLPIQCRDGQCVRSKQLCAKVDYAIEQNLIKCYNQGLLLCTSDLVTCTNSLSKCPSRSSCPIGFSKCWDESCIQPGIQSCPKVTSVSQEVVLSTCADQSSFQYHCFSDGSCRSSLSDCPSISYCPPERPVKCMDKSCRSSIKNCPISITCPFGYKFCPGEGTCVSENSDCGTPTTCSDSRPYRCEDGSCESAIENCFLNYHSLNADQLNCIEDPKNVLCLNNMTMCTTNITFCPSSIPCTGSHLVKSGDSLLCYETRSEFSNDYDQLENKFDCYLSNMYRCKNGTCSEKPCDEWEYCDTNFATYKCWDGQCVSDPKYCKNALSGCPFYTPYRCNYTGQCVKNYTECLESNKTKQLAERFCQNQYNMKYACQFEGSCTNQLTQCSSSPQYCINSYPNNQKLLYGSGKCYVSVCPEQYPFKCSNGLCVSQLSNCPINLLSTEDINYCTTIANQLKLNIRVPCGNGQCVENSEQCEPLYDCSLNLNTQAFFRCPDGTCRQRQSDCPQNYSFCPSHIPFMCSNGMCTKSADYCLNNDNGCPQNLPYKCQYTGLCTANLDGCYNPYSQMLQMFIYPNYIPPITSTPLVAFYGRTRSFCQAKGQFTCKIFNEMPYCVDRLNDCIMYDNNCPVNKPIRCGAQCLTSYLDCKQDSCSDQSMDKCPIGNGCLISNTTCITQDGCPLTTPFKCSTLQKGSCNVLPYTSYPQFYSQTCKASDRQTVQYSNIYNDCIAQDTPYSCADGSCVQDINQCPTCNYYCGLTKKCVRNASECTILMTINSNRSNTLIQQIDQNCPLSAPIRCILTGRCVSDEISCSQDQSTSFKLYYNYTYSGGLLSEKCPFRTPIRCQDGRCSSTYDECLKLIKKKYNSTILTSNPFKLPVNWGQQPNFDTNNSTCQVVCYDGSCRDRVENCPLTQGCYDPQKPYRCRSGFCAKDQFECINLFGSTIESEDTSILVSDSCTESSTVSTANTQYYHRCEDGTCRPIVKNETTGQSIVYCLPFMGCPITKPFHCSTGECAVNKDSCAGASECPYNRPFRCKNFKCVLSVSDCERPFSTYTALQIDATINVLQDNEINFAYTSTGIPIGKVLIPSNALTLTDTQFSTEMQAIQRIQLYPMPDSILDNVINLIPENRVSYLQRIYPLTSSGQLSRGLTLLSPAVKIESATGSILDHGYIYFKVDEDSFPLVLDIKEDICLGKIFDISEYLQGKANWQCQERGYNQTDDGLLQFKINSLGIYAVIINPNPDSASNVQTTNCGLICQNHLMVLVLEFSIVALVIVFLYAIQICCRTKKPPRQKRDPRQSSSGINEGFMHNPLQKGFYTNPALFETLDRFQTPEIITEVDIDQLKDHLDSVDPQDPPLMPGQVVMVLASQHETQKKQIDVLKNQLQEYQEKEIYNLSLIKAIFEKNKILQTQMDLEKEIKGENQSKQGKSVKSRRPKRVKEDPSIMTEYNNIDQYLAQSIKQNQMQFQMEQRQMSAATFEQFPGHNNSMMQHFDRNKQGDQSLQSIPIQQIYGGSSNMIISESTKNLLTQKNYQSTSKLETMDNQHMLIKDDDYDEFQLNELNSKRRNETYDEQLHSIEEEEKDGDEQSLINKKNRHTRQDSMGQDYSMENLTSGIDTSSLQQTLNALFQNPRSRQNQGEKDTKGYNMVMAAEGISGTKSGQIIANNMTDQISSRYEEAIKEKLRHSRQIADDENIDDDLMRTHNQSSISKPHQSPGTVKKKSPKKTKEDKKPKKSKK